MEQKYYQVFEIDICEEPYAIDYVLIGAESIEDLWENAKIYFPKNTHVSIKPVKDAFTTTPYKILERYSYYE